MMSNVRRFTTPHMGVEDLIDASALPKVPHRDYYPDECPIGCTRGCKKFYEAHTDKIAFAMYATQNPELNPRTICIYSFSCGMELLGEKVTLQPMEAPTDLLKRAIPALLRIFVECAVADKEEQAQDGLKDN